PPSEGAVKVSSITKVKRLISSITKVKRLISSVPT
ncbi:unnamed protein product, partial [marine sediment metagenome]